MSTRFTIIYVVHIRDLRAAISAFCQHYSNQQELPEMSAVAKWNPVTDGVMTLKPSTSYVFFLLSHQCFSCIKIHHLFPISHRFPIQWQVKNTGLYPWPKGTHLTLANAFEDHLPHPEIFKILEQLIPHYQKTITVRMISPSQTGTYTARWKMVAPCGTYCGGKSPYNFISLY